MKTTQGKAVSAFSALTNIARNPMKSFAAYKLFRLRKALSPILEFQGEQEQKLVAELGGSVDENGQIRFADTNKLKEYTAKHKELESLECEIETERITMMPKELPDISLADMESLEPFIDWKE